MKNKGFTLLEILIVVSVLAILIGIIVPRIKGFQDEANIAKAKAEIKTLQAAVESYKINNNALPANVAAALTGASPKIISATLWDKLSNAQYLYATDGTTNGYYVISSSTDGTPTVLTVTNQGVVGTLATSDFCVTNGTGC